KCHPCTIYRFLMNEGFGWKPMFDVFHLKEEHRLNRIAFGRNHLEDSWDTTIFIDESTFTLYNHRRNYYRAPGTKRARAVPKYPKKIHACGAFSIHGHVALHLFRRNLDAKY